MVLKGASPLGNASASINNCPLEASQVWNWQKATEGKAVGTVHLGKVSLIVTYYIQMEMGRTLRKTSSLAFEERFLHLWFALQQDKIREGFPKNDQMGQQVREHSSHKIGDSRSQWNRTHAPIPLGLSVRGFERGLEGRRLILM